MASFGGRFANLLQPSDSRSQESLFDSKTTFLFFHFFLFFFFCICCGLLTLLFACTVITRKRKCRSTETSLTAPFGRDNKNEYDVFLSFRGPDTRLTIADSLYFALIRAGISVFKDNEELRVGEKIGGELLQAIDNSKIYIPIFSKDYASSKWCLQEIAYMVECKKRSSDKVIFPIFCDVDADDAKLKTKLYRNALRKHSSKSIGKDVKKQWEEALMEVAKIKGLNLKDHGLDELTKLIVEEVCGTLWTRREDKVPHHLVGIQKPMEDIMKLLDQGTSNIRFVVIHGIAGVGKTTLARLVFNRISSQFEGCCIFLSDVRESSCTSGGIISLQEKLLSKILNLRSLTIHDIDDGVDMIRQRLKDKKVLIVLDDLDKNVQLEKLAGAPSWFGEGSIIIITTRNVDHLLDNEVRSNDNNVLTIVKREDFYFHEMQAMRPDDALKLFSKHAFKRDLPPPDFYNISRKVVATTGGLPLAIEVIGPLFYLKGKTVWKDRLEKLKKVVHQDVREKLLISYTDLDCYEKQIFLDIACLFIDKEKIEATYYWEARGFFPKSGINVLINKSLVKIIDGDKLWMHDLLRDLGRNIVHEENSETLGKRSRLWSPKEALDVIQRKKGTKKVVALKLGRLDAGYSFTCEQFESLTNLMFLELDGGNFANGEFNGDFSELRWLSWDNCPYFQASNLSFDNLVILKLSGKHITETWGGWRPIMEAKYLKVLNLTRCPCLMRTPNFSAFPMLRRLAFRDCHGLKEIDQSIGELKRLDYLTISNDSIDTFQGYSLEMTPQLRRLPDSIIGLTSLTVLKIDMVGLTELHPSIGELVALEHLCLACPHLGNLPNSIGKLTSLLKLDISFLGIKKLPDSIGDLKRLNTLWACKSTIHELPKSIGRLESLNDLDVSETKITELPGTIGNLKALKKLTLDDTPIRKLPSDIGKMHSLEYLSMWGCLALDGDIPEEIGKLSSLRYLYFGLTPIGRVPTTINQLSHLEILYLSDFDGQLPKLPTSLKTLSMDCSALDLERVSDLSYLTNLVHLELLDRMCRSLNVSQPQFRAPKMDWLVRLTKLDALTLVLSDDTLLPTDLSSLSQLKSLFITCFDPQQEVTQPPLGLTGFGLGHVKLPIEIRSPLLSSLKNVHILKFSHCWLREIQVDALGELENLRRLWIAWCEPLERLSGLSCLKNLEDLFFRDCPKLIEIQDLEEAEMLWKLEFLKCNSIQRLPNLSSLQKLERLIFVDCELLTSIPDVTNKETCLLTVRECPQLHDFNGPYHEYVAGQ